MMLVLVHYHPFYTPLITIGKLSPIRKPETLYSSTPQPWAREYAKSVNPFQLNMIRPGCMGTPWGHIYIYHVWPSILGQITPSPSPLQTCLIGRIKYGSYQIGIWWNMVEWADHLTTVVSLPSHEASAPHLADRACHGLAVSVNIYLDVDTPHICSWHFTSL